MPRSSLEATLVKRFHLQGAPTLQARVSSSAPPIAFSRIRNDRPQPERSITPPRDSAFVFQLPLAPSMHPDLRYTNRPPMFSGVQQPGQAFLLDMSAGPTVHLDTVFDTFRLYMSQSAIDDLAYEKGLRRVGGLRQAEMGSRDPVLFHLAMSLAPALETPELVSAAFVDYLGLAFHAHVIATYGGAAAPRARLGGRLAPWQMRRLREFVDANPGANHSIQQLALICELSPSYFSEAFRHSFGMPPHQWLLRQRIDRAKTLLQDTALSLAAIAAECGFFDQSHFSRVFSRTEHVSPTAWRHLHRTGRPPAHS